MKGHHSFHKKPIYCCAFRKPVNQFVVQNLPEVCFALVLETNSQNILTYPKIFCDFWQSLIISQHIPKPNSRQHPHHGSKEEIQAHSTRQSQHPTFSCDSLATRKSSKSRCRWTNSTTSSFTNQSSSQRCSASAIQSTLHTRHTPFHDPSRVSQ